MIAITPRLSVEGPDKDGRFKLHIQYTAGEAQIEYLQPAEASALLQALQPAERPHCACGVCKAARAVPWNDPPSGSAPEQPAVSWLCGCGAWNGINLAACGACRRSRGESDITAQWAAPPAGQEGR